MTNRQKRLFRAIIKEFIDTAEAVGSLTIGDKYDLDISPATIRNEMVRLIDEGYLDKQHSSAGRIPTVLGWRYFLKELMKEVDIYPEEETKVKEDLFHERFNKQKLLRKAVYNLSKICKLPSVAITDETIYISGLAEIVLCPEFSDLEVLQNVISILEDFSLLSSVFKRGFDDDNVNVLIGEEIGYKSCADCALVFRKIHLHRGEEGYISVFGPQRMDYERVIPNVRAISNMISNVISGW